MDIVPQKTARNLRRMINESGMSPAGVALGAMIPEEVVARYVSGKGDMEPPVLRKIVEFLDKDYAELFK